VLNSRIVVFCMITLCILVVGYQHFGGIFSSKYIVHFTAQMEIAHSCTVLQNTRLYGVIAQCTQTSCHGLAFVVEETFGYGVFCFQCFTLNKLLPFISHRFT
jgi:uncharacterized membrane protein